MNYRSLCKTNIGSVRLKQNRSCSDASYATVTLNSGMVIVAGGHEAAHCPRAALGSRFAVEAARKALEEAAETPEYHLDQLWQAELIMEIQKRYERFCLNHVNANPPTPEELLAVNPGKVLEWYGCGLAAILITPFSTLCLALGENDLALLLDDGTVFHPIPASDAGDESVRAGSMYMKPLPMRMMALPAPARAALVATDGAKKALLDKSEFGTLCGRLMEAVAEDPSPAIHTSFDELVKLLAGCDDDVSIAVLAAADPSILYGGNRETASGPERQEKPEKPARPTGMADRKRRKKRQRSWHYYS